MSQKIFLLISLLLYTGCVERGYELTVNNNTNTITAIKSVDIRKQTTSTKADMDKMNTAVTKEHEKQPSSHIKIKKQDTELKKIDDNKKHMEEKKIQAQKQLAKQKQLTDRKLIEDKKIKAQQNQKERNTLKEKLAQEKETKRLAAQKEIKALETKSRLEKEAAKKKEATLIQKIKEKEKKEAMKKKLALETALRKAKDDREKLALKRKIEKEKQAQLLKEKQEKARLEKKITAEKKAIEKKRVEQLKKVEEAEKERLEKARLEKARLEKARLEKARLEKATSIDKKKEAKEQKKTPTKNKPLPVTETLTFKPSSQTYQKFGTSEIHGHVVYLTSTGKEINLKNTKVYLVPRNTKTDYWYNHYYLKNKEASSLSKSTVQYINATHLNLEKNFAFYGLATGTYYIIIESLYPASIAKNKKVYIAKKINVEKYKKIMTVFSKKL